MKQEMGDSFSVDKVNLAELERVTGISRSRLRRYKKDGFIIKPHGNTGRKAETTVLSGYTGVIDELLRSNTTCGAVSVIGIYSGKLHDGYRKHLLMMCPLRAKSCRKK